MAKTGGATLITELGKRVDVDHTDATVRLDLLARLSKSLKEIVQDFSLSFLNTTGTLTVAASACAVPLTIDMSKAMTLKRISGDGEIEYVPPDQWYRTRIDLYGEGATPTEPTHYTIALVSGLTFLFLPAGLNGTVEYQAQVLVGPIADSGVTCELPEGWEDTLLLDHAESEWKRIEHDAGWQELSARINDKKERLYNSYRTTKEQAMTDREQGQRKVAKTQLADEA